MLEGAILAGGTSRRMGRDKAALEIGGKTLVARAADVLSPLVERVLLVGRDDGLVAETAIDAVRDLYPGLGPLAGIHTALATSKAEAVLVLACDLPFATTAFLRSLVERLTAGYDAVVPSPASGPVPVCAVYRTSLAPAIEERLLRRELAAQSFVESIAARLVGEPELSSLDPGGRCLVNVNTPADYQRALRLEKG